MPLISVTVSQSFARLQEANRQLLTSYTEVYMVSLLECQSQCSFATFIEIFGYSSFISGSSLTATDTNLLRDLKACMRDEKHLHKLMCAVRQNVQHFITNHACTSPSRLSKGVKTTWLVCKV
uniref:Uncharacterized protein n=1 Tax=Glossina austeni TaxID=7395 RepID=A0A1A9UDV5_GLOAU